MLFNHENVRHLTLFKSPSSTEPLSKTQSNSSSYTFSDNGEIEELIYKLNTSWDLQWHGNN